MTNIFQFKLLERMDYLKYFQNLFNYYFGYKSITTTKIHFIETAYKPSIRKGYQGLYLNSNFILTPGIICDLGSNRYQHDLEDPLFPIDQLTNCLHGIRFQKLLKKSISEYIKSEKSKLYNIRKIGNNYQVIQEIKPDEELLVYKGIGYWLLELLRILPDKYHQDWYIVVSDMKPNIFSDDQYKILVRVLQDLNWRNNFLDSNPQITKRMPPIHIEYNIPY